MSIHEVLEMIRGRTATRHQAKELLIRPNDLQSIMLAQAARLAKGAPHGTTIVAIEYDDGIVMAADRLATQYHGDVFSRTEIKLKDINKNAVLGICGSLAFAQNVIEDLENFCDVISAKIKRPISIQGKSNLIKQIIKTNIFDLPWHQLMGVSFGAILGGYDHYDGKIILSFDTDGGIYPHEKFATDGSGYSQARDYIHDRFQYDLSLEEATGIAIGAIRQAGKFVTSVSHPLDPPPTVKVISQDGIRDVSEESILQWILETEEEEEQHLFG
ncbi:MAG: hypothetical protein Q7K44_03270, partial [Candidatus Liptonbacteria bacterium]|nr:hypothetical protein [Candidatus Liptonbacteria bacterium]